MGEYSKASIIKYTRKSRGITQEELAFGVCDTVTLSRYENGQVEPTDEKFMRLMKKLGEDGNLYLFPLEGESLELERAMDEILLAVEQYDWDRAEALMAVMKEEHGLSMEHPENRQYLMRIETIIQDCCGRIGWEEACRRYEQALELTLGEHALERLRPEKVLRETEVLLLYNLATLYGDHGKTEEAEALFLYLDRYFHRSDMVNDGKPRYLIYLAYANFLGRQGRHDKSIEVCEREIEWLVGNNKANYLYNFYYNIGWNIKEKIKKGMEKEERMPEAKMYMWLAYQLCLGYPEDRGNLPIIEKNYLENVGII